MSTSKEQDYLVWLRETIEAMEEAGKANTLPDIGVNWPNVIEEMYEAGRLFTGEALRTVSSILLDHFREIIFDIVQVNESGYKQIEQMLKKSPSLLNYLNENLKIIYEYVVELAEDEDRNGAFTFSKECPTSDVRDFIYRPNFAKLVPKIFIKPE